MEVTVEVSVESPGEGEAGEASEEVEEATEGAEAVEGVVLTMGMTIATVTNQTLRRGPPLGRGPTGPATTAAQTSTRWPTAPRRRGGTKHASKCAV